MLFLFNQNTVFSNGFAYLDFKHFIISVDYNKLVGEFLYLSDTRT